jgi:hypothetical protein
MEYSKGDRVHVEFEGTINGPSSNREGFINVTDETGFVHLIWPKDDDSIMTHIEPEYEFGETKRPLIKMIPENGV